MKYRPLELMVALVFGAASSSSADPLAAYEGFDYPPGTPLAGGNGGIGFASPWAGASVFGIASGSLNTGGPDTGNSVQIGGNGTVTRSLKEAIGAAGTVRYLSVFGQVLYPLFGSPPQGVDRVGVTLTGSAGAGVFFGKPGGQFKWALENAAGGGQVVGPYMFAGVPSTQTLLVIKCEFFAGNDRFTLYVNPVRGQPEPASGTVKFDSDVGSVTNLAFTVSTLEGYWNFDELRLATTFADAVPVLPANHAPDLANAIPDQNGGYGAPFTYTVPENSFVDSDAGQTLTYGASGLPPGISFDGATRTFSGTPTNANVYAITVTVTDSGSPPLSTNDTFNISVAKALLVVSANNTNRPYGAANPTFSGTLAGVTNHDDLSASFSAPATLVSPPGDYPILPTLLDPDGRLVNYELTINPGTLTVGGVTLDYGLSAGLASLCWPATAAASGLEYTESLTPPITWQPVTSRLLTNASTVCLTAAPAPGAPARFYRLHLP